MASDASKLAEDLADSSYEVLLENATFLSYGNDEQTRYFAGAEALDALGWLITDAVIPIILGVASSAIYTLAQQKGATEPVELNPESIHHYHLHVTTLLADQPVTTEYNREAAIEKASEILLTRGWPELEATADAARIVDSMAETLRRA